MDSILFAKKTHKIIIYWLSTRFCLQRKTIHHVTIKRFIQGNGDIAKFADSQQYDGQKENVGSNQQGAQYGMDGGDCQMKDGNGQSRHRTPSRKTQRRRTHRQTRARGRRR